MGHEQNRGGKEKKKPAKNDKKQKGIPPHLQRERDDSTSKDINKHMEDVARKQQSGS